LAEAILSKSPHPIAVAAGTLVLVCLIGAFMMVPSIVCMPGLIGDGACAAKPLAPAVVAKPMPVTAPEPAAATAVAVVPAAAAPTAPTAAAAVTAAIAPAKAAATLTGNKLISASFDQLRGTPTATGGGGNAMTAQQAVDNAVALAPNPAPVGPKARVVATTAVRPDGSLIGGSPAAAGAPDALGFAADTGTVPLAPVNPSSDDSAATAAAAVADPSAPAANAAPTTQVASADTGAANTATTVSDVPASPVPLAPPPTRVATAAPTAKSTAAAASSGTTMIVGGSGVTVRSAPHTKSGPLFNLAAGQKVTVAERSHNWLRITDSQGRSGWAYASLFRGGKSK